MARLIDANKLKQLILAERDKIPTTLPSAIYEFGIPKPNHHGNSMRGGIRKALRCMEQCETIDAVPVVRCKDCKHFVEGEPYDPCECMKWKTRFGVAYTTPDGYCHKGERKKYEG